MYANLAVSIYLAMHPGTVATCDEIHSAPVVVELQSHDEGKDQVQVGKRIVVLAQVNEEEEERGEREPRDRERRDRDQASERRERERSELQEAARERRRAEAERGERDRRRVEVRVPEGGPQAEAARIERRLREQAERIERLEGNVRRLQEAVERLRGGESVGSREERPRGWSALGRTRPAEASPIDPEARVRALEQALAQLKERASGSDDERRLQMRRAIEARADAERRKAEAARRALEKEATSRMLEQIRTKREQVKKDNAQQREAVSRQMREALERLEKNFQASDAQMEKTIAELEKKLAALGEGEKQDKLKRE